MNTRHGGAGNGDSTIILNLLNAVERDSNTTQRHLARELGIALGLANAYLRRCTRKGLIKIRQVPLNRYAYYVTPRGFAEKSRLTAEYLTVSFDFFRRARSDAVSLLSGIRARGWTRVALWGAGDLAEVVILSAAEAEIEVVCVIDAAAAAGSRSVGRPVVADIDAALALDGAIDVFVLTDTRAPRESFAAALAAGRGRGIGAERVLALATLRLSPSVGALAK